MFQRIFGSHGSNRIPRKEALRLAKRMKNTDAITELDRRFGIPGTARIVPGQGGMPKVEITTPAAAGEMYLHGAHVTSWRPVGGDEVFFVSSKSRWQDGVAIRGGVPICFPWFGNKADHPKAPAHGFVRTKSWQLDAVTASGDDVTVSMSTGSDGTTRKWWPADFRLIHCATFSSELTLELELHNTGDSPLRFEEALHSYFKVDDVRTAPVSGLDEVRYLDKTDENREVIQKGNVVIAGETDRVYLDTQGGVVLLDRGFGRRTSIAKENSLTSVVWNPWEQKAKAMSDLGAGEWVHMLCVEISNVLGAAVEVAPGQQHRMKAVIQVVEL